MQRFGLALMALAAAAMPATPAVAACDPAAISAASNPFPYRMLAAGYCEGTFTVDVDASFQIFSFTIGELAFNPALDHLDVSAPLSPPGMLAIRGRGRNSTYGYQLDAALSPPDGFRWPTAHAIRPLRLQSDELGAFGMRPNGGGFRLVPLLVGHGAAGAPLLMRLIAPENLIGPVSYALLQAHQPPHWLVATRRNPDKGDLIDIVLPANALDAAPILSVRAQSRTMPPHDVKFSQVISR